LDLLGAFEDVEDFGVSGPLFQEVVFGVAEGAGQFYAAQGDVALYAGFRRSGWL